MAVQIRPMTLEDIASAADVHRAAFPRQDHSLEWIQCNFNAYPRMQYFVAAEEGEVVGFIHWSQKSGLRRQAVLELEQIGVSPERQGRGIGTQLILKSLPHVARQLAGRGAVIKHIVVTTRCDNAAQRLYSSALGAEPAAIIHNLYSADEVFMIARDVGERFMSPPDGPR